MWVTFEHEGQRRRVAVAWAPGGCWVDTAGGAVLLTVAGAAGAAGAASDTALLAPHPASDDAGPQADAAYAPMTGRVVALQVAPGDQVAAGATLAVLEAMKMEYRVAAPHGLTVAEVCCRVGEQVELGACLLRFAPPAPPA